MQTKMKIHAWADLELPFYKTFYEEMNIIYNIHQTLLCLSKASYITIKAFDYFGRASK